MTIGVVYGLVSSLDHSEFSFSLSDSFFSWRPLLRILNISLSPSSPYLPVSVVRFSIAGVSRGWKPYSSNMLRSMLRMYWRLRTTSGEKSLVPCGIDGFIYC